MMGLAGCFAMPETEPIEVLETGTDDRPVERRAVNAQFAVQVPGMLHASGTHGTA